MLSFNSSKALSRNRSGAAHKAACDHFDVACRTSHTKACDHNSVATAPSRTTGRFGGWWKKTVAAVACALSFFVGSGVKSDAFPVSTKKTVEHAALIKSAPAYQEFPEELQRHIHGGDDGHLKRMNLLEWKSAEPKDAYILCIHAWGLSAREFNDFGAVMSAHGFDTAAIDVRGFGLDRKKHGMKRIDFPGTVQDISKLLGSVRKRNPDKKIFVVGESMGGALALKVGADFPDLVDGVIVSAPAWQISGVKRLTFEGLFDQVFGEPGFAARSVANMASNNSDLKKQWLTDESYRMNYSVPEAYDYYRLMRSTPLNAKNIKDVPVLILQGLGDRLSKPEASALLFKRIQNPSKQFAIVAGSEHLVLEEGQLTEKVSSFVEDWILSQMNNAGDENKTPSVVVIDNGEVKEAQRQELEKLKDLAGFERVKQLAGSS